METMTFSYCGGSSVHIKPYSTLITAPFSKPAEVILNEMVCDHCGFSEDCSSNDEIVQNVFNDFNRESIITVITELNELGFSNASMERALRLPARTLQRWKNSNTIIPSAAGLALMRIIRTFPWIIAVADEGFKKEYADQLIKMLYGENRPKGSEEQSTSTES